MAAAVKLKIDVGCGFCLACFQLFDLTSPVSSVDLEKHLAHQRRLGIGNATL